MPALLRSVARSLASASSSSAAGSSSRAAARSLQTSAVRARITPLVMPAMSPTMTEGGIARWALSPGDAFSAGDVILEIETDKATMDVEAPDDGIFGKVVIEAGSKNVRVGDVIAMLAEEGDDISNIEVPASSEAAPAKEEKPAAPVAEEKPRAQASAGNASSAPAPSHASTSPPTSDHGSRVFPSVARLLAENDLRAADVKGTGVRGMLTKGDVLAHLGKAKSPTGSFVEKKEGVAALGGQAMGGAKKPTEGSSASPAKPASTGPLSPNELRRLILGGLSSSSSSSRAAALAATPASKGSFAGVLDDLLSDYAFKHGQEPAAKRRGKDVL